MASIFKRNGMIHISWYDWFTGKNVTRSTKLRDTRENRKTVKQWVKELEKEMQVKKEKYEKLKLRKACIADCFQHFLKLNKDKNENTIYGYKFFYGLFKKRFAPEENCTVITKESIEDWIGDIKDLDKAQNTKYNYYKILKKFLSFLFEYNYIPTFTINKEAAIKRKNVEIIIFNRDDLQKMIEGLKNKNNNFITMFYLLLYTGLRPSDIKDITVEDIDLENGALQYYSPKTEEYFFVPLHDELVSILAKRIDEVKKGKLLEYTHIRNMSKAFQRYMEELDLKGKKYNLRTFRKTFISLAYEQGIELAMVSTLVGHKKIQTTQQYYNKIGLHQKTKELKKFKLPVKKESSNYSQSYLIE